MPAPRDQEQLAWSALARGDYAAAELHADQWHAQTDRPAPLLLPSALWYASVGLRVFPLQPGRKTPLPGSRGCKDASGDHERIARWWAAIPNANVGIATGYKYDVIDIDGHDGAISWARMDDLPIVYGVVATPRPGGSHLYIEASGLGNRAGMAPGVDVRGLGGYVVAPPSVNAEGVRYRWRRPLGQQASHE